MAKGKVVDADPVEVDVPVVATKEITHVWFGKPLEGMANLKHVSQKGSIIKQEKDGVRIVSKLNGRDVWISNNFVETVEYESGYKPKKR